MSSERHDKLLACSARFPGMVSPVNPCDACSTVGSVPTLRRIAILVVCGLTFAGSTALASLSAPSSPAVGREHSSESAKDLSASSAEDGNSPSNGGNQPGRLHWAFQPPGDPKPPEVRNAKWVQTDLDRFV